MTPQKFTIDEILDLTEEWLITGVLNPHMLANHFEFTSPFWQRANKEAFLAQFGDPKSYQETALSKITHFDPVIKLKDSDGKHFAIVLQYHTRNGNHVYEKFLNKKSKEKCIMPFLS